MEKALIPVQIVVLAAGHGKRMNNSELPKVLVTLKGRPIIVHLLDAIKLSGVCQRPVIVVGQQAEQVMSALGSDYTYIFQSEQLGTGDAVKCAQAQLQDRVENILVLYGDHPFVSPDTIKKLALAHQNGGQTLTMATVKIDDFDSWRQSFYDFGRIIRDSSGNIEQIIEKKDATPEQLNIAEVNPGYFCFKADWLWPNLANLKNDNSQHEYYLTDLVSIFTEKGGQINNVIIEPKDALGINTVEQLELLDTLLG